MTTKLKGIPLPDPSLQLDTLKRSFVEQSCQQAEVEFMAEAVSLDVYRRVRQRNKTAVRVSSTVSMDLVTGAVCTTTKRTFGATGMRSRARRAIRADMLYDGTSFPLIVPADGQVPNLK
jgi:hypothetical protein